jgi:glutaredoxin
MSLTGAIDGAAGGNASLACALEGVRKMIILAALLVLLSTPLASSAAEAEPGKAAPANEILLEVFVRSDSEHSQRAAAFARQFPGTHPGVRLQIHDVLNDEAARRQFWALAKKFGAAKPGLPAFFACNRARFGFADATTSGRAIEDLFVIRAFVREGCPHCRDAKRFLSALQRRWPALRIEHHDVVSDPQSQQRLTELTQRYAVQVPSLPAIEVFNQVVVGYDTDATTGRQIEDLVRAASVPSAGAPEGVLPPQSQGLRRGSRRAVLFGGRLALALQPQPQAPLPAEKDALSDISDLPPIAEQDTTVVAPSTAPPIGIEIPGWGMLQVSDLGLPAFTFVIGLLDGFNPCAMWVLVFLLSILVNVRSRVRILAIAGTFVLVSGLAYFAFMAAWLNVFLLVGYTRWLEIALGLFALFIGVVNVKDFVAFKHGFSLSIPDSAKKGIYARVRQIVTAQYLSIAIAMSVVMAVSVNVIEVLCTAGLPAVYTQILTAQQLPAWQNYAFLLLYNLAYMLDDTLLLAAFVITLSHRKIQEREGRWLKLVSGLVILALGLVMLFAPEWLKLTTSAR